MLQNTTVIEKRHNKFVKDICSTQIVWALKSEKGFAMSGSNDYENEEGEPIGLICFWSDQALAKACLREEWKDYTLEEISLADFIENWCIGMFNDGLLVGTNFDRNLFGFEIEPLELVMELITEIRENNYNVILEKFKGLDDIEGQIKESLE